MNFETWIIPFDIWINTWDIWHFIFALKYLIPLLFLPLLIQRELKMAKLSNILINSFLSLTYANNFGVTNCSNDVSTLLIYRSFCLTHFEWRELCRWKSTKIILKIILPMTVHTLCKQQKVSIQKQSRHTIWIFPAIMMVSNNWFLSLGPQNFISDIILSHTVQTTGTKISYGTSTIRLVLQKFKRKFKRTAGTSYTLWDECFSSLRTLIWYF